MRIFFSIIFLLSLNISVFATEGSLDSNKKQTNISSEMEKISKRVGFSLEENHAPYLPLYNEAIKWLGVRYRRAGMSFKGVDCSGLTSVLYKNVFNTQLQRSSIDISRSIDKEVAKDKLKPGDLVFFSTRGRKNINHVGVFLGDRKFIHASISQGVIISSLDEAYYQRTWRKGGRVELKQQISHADKTKREIENFFPNFKKAPLNLSNTSIAQYQFKTLKDQNLKYWDFSEE